MSTQSTFVDVFEVAGLIGYSVRQTRRILDANADVAPAQKFQRPGSKSPHNMRLKWLRTDIEALMQKRRAG